MSSNSKSKSKNKGLFSFLYRKNEAEKLIPDFKDTDQFSKIKLSDYAFPFNSTIPAVEFVTPADMLAHMELQYKSAKTNGLIALDEPEDDFKWMRKALVAPPRSIKPFDLLITAHRYPDGIRYAILCLIPRMDREDINTFKNTLLTDSRFSMFPGGFGEFSAISLKHLEGDYISEIQELLDEHRDLS